MAISPGNLTVSTSFYLGLSARPISAVTGEAVSVQRVAYRRDPPHTNRAPKPSIEEFKAGLGYRV